MSLQERILLLKHYRSDFSRVGTLTHSSRWLADAITAPLARARQRSEPIRTLEVGVGTGTLTRALARLLRPQDRLTACEINDDFVNWIRRQLIEDQTLAAARDRIEIVHAPLQSIERNPIYDFIISSLPFNSFPPELVRESLEIFRSVSKPGATVSFYEYIGVRPLWAMVGGRAERARLRAVSAVLRECFAEFLTATDVVLLNCPPAYVRHLQWGANGAPPTSA